MPEVATKLKTYRFDQMAVQVKDKVHPDDADVERYVGLEHIDPESLKIRRWGEPSDVESTKILFRAGDIIFGKRRAYQRKLAVADFDGICSAHAMVLRPKTDVVLKEFLPFFMQTDTFMERAVKISVGGLSPTINWRDLAKEEFALPPIEEQRRLSRVLTAAQACLNATDALVDSLDTVHESHLAAVVESLSRRTNEIELGEVADVRYGLTVNQQRRKASTTAPYLRVANVGRGVLILDEVKDIGQLPGDESHVLREGDVLIVEGHANPDEIGRAAVWAGEIPGAMHQNHIIRARCGAKLDSRYLLAVINSPHGRRYFRSRAKSSSGLNTINSSVVKGFRIPLPSVEHQRELASRCSEAAAAIPDALSHRTRYQSIIQSVLAASEAAE